MDGLNRNTCTGERGSGRASSMVDGHLVSIHSLGAALSEWQSATNQFLGWGTAKENYGVTEGATFEATLRPSDRSSERAIDRSTERSNDRAIERSSDRATERAMIERSTARAIERSTVIASRAPEVHLTR